MWWKECQSKQTVYYHVHSQLYGKTRKHLYLNLKTTSLQIIKLGNVTWAILSRHCWNGLKAQRNAGFPIINSIFNVQQKYWFIMYLWSFICLLLNFSICVYVCIFINILFMTFTYYSIFYFYYITHGGFYVMDVMNISYIKKNNPVVCDSL